MHLTAPQKNALHGLDMLLRLSKVRVTRATLQEKLWHHPDFPSLTSLSDTLDDLRVDNIAAHLTPDKLPEIPLPALAYLVSEGGFFAPVRATAADAVEWWHNKRGWQKEPLAEFGQKWSGITLLIEPTERSGEADYAQNRKKERVEKLRLPFVVLSLLACLAVWAGGYGGAPLHLALLSLKLAGLLASSLLVWYGLDAKDPFLRSICQLNARTSCSTVLSTTAANLFSWLSWAEVGLFYFGGGLLALLFFRENLAVLYPLLFGMTIAALPYTFWSVYYQWQRARQWCVLCLTVQGLLWLEFGTLLYFQRHLAWPLGFGVSEASRLLASFLLLPALWALLKPILSKALRTDGLQGSLQRIKFDPGYMESLSQRARMLPPVFTGMEVPTLGSAEATNTLIVVTNPTCSRCAQAHQEVEALVAELEDVKCQIILAPANRRGDAGAFVAHRILSQPVKQIPLALQEWYAAPQLEKWLKSTTLGEATDEGATQLGLHRRWCELAGVSATPAVFFNGIEIPQHYTILESKQLLNFLKARVGQLA